MGSRPVTRIGDKTTGHSTYKPRPAIEGSGDVFANSIGVNRVGDAWAPHGGDPAYRGDPHPGESGHTTSAGSGSVFANNKAVARIGDPVEGDTIAAGSPNVFAGSAAGTFGIASVSVTITIPEGDQLAAETLVDNYVTAQTGQPNTYYKPEAAADGVKGNYAGTPESSSVPDGAVASDPSASDIIPFLEARLAEAATGAWRESGMKGNPSNTKITGIWTNLGYPASNPWTTDQTAWCMGFVNYALKNSGYKYVQTASAAAITTTPEKWSAVQVPKAEARPGDIAFWSYRHVNFVYTAANGKYSFVGGNQTPSGGKNNPDDGDITISYPGGTAASNANWVSCWRITKT